MGEVSAFSEIQSIVGAEAAEELCFRLGGESVYIPRRPELDANVIAREFNAKLHDGSTCGNAYKQIAQQHDVSARTIMRLIATG